MLIYDGFPDVEAAKKFAAQVEQQFGLKTQIFDNVSDAQANDPIPASLNPPIVHVQRWKDDKDYSLWVKRKVNREPEIEDLAIQNGGVFVGS